MRIFELTDDGPWVDPDEIVAVHVNGGTVIELRGGGRVHTDLTPLEVTYRLMEIETLIEARARDDDDA